MGYKSSVQQKNIAWYLPRPKPDKYKGGMPLHCENWLIELAQDLLGINPDEIRLLNLFCGMNQQGFRVDINPDVAPDLVVDAHEVSEHLDTKLFNVIIADPPYSNTESKELYGTGKLNYRKWTEQCDNVLVLGGLLIVYHKAIMPNPNPEKYQVLKRVFIGTRTNHVPRIAIYFQKGRVARKT